MMPRATTRRWAFLLWGLLLTAPLASFGGCVAQRRATTSEGMVRREFRHRRALVIGNSAYDHIDRLRNARGDAEAIAARLRSLDFELLDNGPLTNATRAEIEGAARRFIASLRPGDLALFYYSGHGASIQDADGGTKSFILPTDFPDDLRREGDETREQAVARILREKGFELGDGFLSALSRAGVTSVLFFDACRDDGLVAQVRAAQARGGEVRSVRGAARSFSVTRMSGEAHVIFSTSEGQTADDGDGEHSPFAHALLRHLGEELEVSGLFRAVHREVTRATGGRQAPSQRSEGGSELYLAQGYAVVPDDGSGGERTRREGGCPAGMVYMPGGEYLMGSPDGVGEADEHPQHRVRVAGFCIDRTEVSVAAYRRCVEAGVCTAPKSTREWGYCNWEREGAVDHPVNCVDWTKSRTYCTWTGHEGGARRLLWEAEWEYVAGGRHGTTYPWGNAEFDGTRANLCGSECEIGWSSTWRDGFTGTAPVTAFPGGASPEGVLGLSGNVVEWVEDIYVSDGHTQRSPEGLRPAPESSTESGIRRVLRGGSWDNGFVSAARATARTGTVTTDLSHGIGFRCARGAL